MNTWVRAAALAVAIASIAATLSAQPAGGENTPPTDEAIRRLLVQASIAIYDGVCPCPESLNAQGVRCSGNSAYSRGGASRPLCYPSNVTAAMVRRYREGAAAK